MQIKEMETRTGLTAKAIRYYEQKGLLEVKRSSNEYRDYDEECIERLQMIRLLRGMHISVVDIKKWIDEECTLLDVLTQHLSDLECEILQNQIYITLCHECIQELEQKQSLDPSQHIKIIEETKDEDFKEISKLSSLIGQHSLIFYIVSSLVFLGPIIWLYMYLGDASLVASPYVLLTISLVEMIILTLLWQEYFRHRKEYKNRKKGNLKVFLMLLVILILMLLFLFVIAHLQEAFFIPDGYLMWTMPPLYTMMFFAFMIEMFAFFGMIVYRNTKNDDIREWKNLWTFLCKHKYIVILLNIVYLYICGSNVDVVVNGNLQSMRWYAPVFKTYECKDIEYVETGFHKSLISLPFQRTGDFYYHIQLRDGRNINLSQPNPRKEDKYQEHTYLEIEEYDAYLSSQGVQKVASEENKEYNTLADEYKDRFLRIINNK